MTDIVRRLRFGPTIHSNNDLELMSRAADEIERLRDFVFEAFKEGFGEGQGGGWGAASIDEPWRISLVRQELEEKNEP